MKAELAENLRGELEIPHLDGSRDPSALKALESDCDTLELRWQQVHGIGN